MLFLLRLVFDGDGRSSFGMGGHSTSGQAFSDQLRDVVIDRAGVGLFFCDAELRQHVDERMGGDLELPSQLVDSDFTHSYCNTLA